MAPRAASPPARPGPSARPVPSPFIFRGSAALYGVSLAVACGALPALRLVEGSTG